MSLLEAGLLGASWTPGDTGRGAATPSANREVGQRPPPGAHPSICPSIRPSVRPSQGEPRGEFALSLSREVIQLTLMSSDFRPTCVSLLLHQRDVPEFITAIISEGHVARLLGDEGDPGGHRGTLCLSPTSQPPACSPGVASGGKASGSPSTTAGVLCWGPARAQTLPAARAHGALTSPSAPCVPPTSSVLRGGYVPRTLARRRVPAGTKRGLRLRLDTSGRGLCCSPLVPGPG